MKFKKFMGGALAATLTLSAFTGGMLSAVAETKQTNQPLAKTAVPYTEEVAADEDYGYLLVHFLGDGYTNGAKEEQLYFTISPDAKQWSILNNGESVSTITSSKPAGSQGGIRDPHIVRKHDPATGLETDGYYIIATDLSVYHLNYNWTASQWEGSHSIIVWEMDKQMTLSEPRMVEIAPENAGCTWAPESIWDEEKNAYMVFWSSLAYNCWNDNGTWKKGQDWAHHVYRCYTNDFVTFTEPEIYMESEQQIIDTTILKEGDTYYRFTKVETKDYDTDRLNPKYGAQTVFMEEGKSLSGEFRMVSTYKINGEHWSKKSGYEGAEIFKLHKRDVTEGDAQWCLALDNFAKGGYKPFITNDISKGEFNADEMNFAVPTRHGAFLPLKKSEYDALCDKWNSGVKPEPMSIPTETARDHKEIFSMSFEDDLTASVGTASLGQGSTAISFVEGVKAGTKAAKFDQSDYIKIDGSVLAPDGECLDSFTVSFAAKFNTPPQEINNGNKNSIRSWLFFAAANNDPINWSASGTHEKYVGIIWGEDAKEILQAQRFWDGRTPSPDEDVYANPNEWKHFTIVYAKGYTSIYVNGWQIAKKFTSIDLTTMLGNDPTIYIGRSNCSGGEYSNCVIDEFRIHNWGMTSTEVRNNYKKIMG